MSDFFMVYVEGTEGTKFRHPTLEDATKEAIRLANKTGKKAWVLSPTREIPAPIRTAWQLKQAIITNLDWQDKYPTMRFDRKIMRELLEKILPDDDQQKDA